MTGEDGLRRRTLPGLQPYQKTVAAMHERADELAGGREGEVWFLQHTPVVTCGRRTSPAMLHVPDTVEVVTTDRGGLATWHGPGQLVIYPLVPVAEGIRPWVARLLEITAAALRLCGVGEVQADGERTGVFTPRGKIASLGIRVKNGINRHGVAINVDLRPNGFGYLDPCGVAGQPIDQTASWGMTGIHTLADRWWTMFMNRYTGG